MSIRIHRSVDAGWTRLANAVLRDPTLTLRAKGLLGQLLSHEDGWQQSLAYAEKQCADGKATIRGAFAELVTAGYATRERHREADGRTKGWDYDVYEYPRFRSETGGNTNVGETNVGPTNVGDMHLLEDSPSSRTPSTEEPQEQALAPTSSPRPRDEVYEVLFTVDTHLPYTQANRAVPTKRELDKINAAAGMVRPTGISAEELVAAIQAWPSVFPDATCTANAVANHLTALRAAAAGHVMRDSGPSREEKDSKKLREELRRREQEREAKGA